MKGKKKFGKTKQATNVKQIPWGVFAGIFAMFWSFLLIAVVAVFVISGVMYAEVGGDDGLTSSWWIIPLFIADGVAFIGCVASTVFYALNQRALILKEPDEEKKDENAV